MNIVHYRATSYLFQMKLQTRKTANNIKTLQEKKLTVTVWDDRIRDICYQTHFQNVRNKSFKNIYLSMLRLSFVAPKYQKKDRQQFSICFLKLFS